MVYAEVEPSWASDGAELLDEAMAKQMLPSTAADADCKVYAVVGAEAAQNYWTRKWPNGCFPAQPLMRLMRYTLKLGLRRRRATGRGKCQTDASQTQLLMRIVR